MNSPSGARDTFASSFDRIGSVRSRFAVLSAHTVVI